MGFAITKDTNLKDLLRRYPDAARVFASYGIGCTGCALAYYETIEQGVSVHGIDVNDFLKDLTEFIASI